MFTESNQQIQFPRSPREKLMDILMYDEVLERVEALDRMSEPERRECAENEQSAGWCGLFNEVATNAPLRKTLIGMIRSGEIMQEQYRGMIRRV